MAFISQDPANLLTAEVSFDTRPNTWLKFLSQPNNTRIDQACAGDNTALWAAEALHRTANLAQLIAAITHLRHKRATGAAHRATQAKAAGLANAYAELAHANGPGVLPCGDLLRQVVSGLIGLFGSSAAGDVRLDLTMAALSLTPDRRRAVVLVASELVVNALKHAFPDGRPGTIAVRLVHEDDWAELTVEDDGVGASDSGPALGHGLGQGLMGGLAFLLAASLATVPVERGYAVRLRFPLA